MKVFRAINPDTFETGFIIIEQGKVRHEWNPQMFPALELKAWGP